MKRLFISAMVSREPVVHTALLLLLCGALYWPYLGAAPFFNKGEPREAMAVQDIVLRGEWLVPLKRATDVPSKPPLFHWFAAAAYYLTGDLDEATVRLPSSLFATLGVLLTYFFARRLFTPEIALLAGAILATTILYQDQALDARVDMTLCFFVMLSITLFYLLYREILRHWGWYYVFFAVTGIGTLAKGPLGLLLPALVAGAFLLLKRRVDLVRTFCFHPGVMLMLALAGGWYAIAIIRGGDGFFERQIIGENLHRFAGGSGHSNPVYYYVPYLFAQGLPWAILLPGVLWDSFKRGSSRADDHLFIKLWFVVMFAFFSLSLGKRPVYLLPLYPAVAVLTAVWLVNHKAVQGARSYYYYGLALFAAFTGTVLLLIVVGELWNHNPALLFAPVESLLKAKDRANFALVNGALADFGTPLAFAALVSSLLWFSLARCFWFQRMLAAALRLVLLCIVFSFIARTLVVPKIAEAKSYRAFMSQVNQLVGPNDTLYLHKSFNSDQVVFYRGEPVETLTELPSRIIKKGNQTEVYVIISEREWLKLRKLNVNLPTPFLKSVATGPEGNAPLVLLRITQPG
ncbi:MAG TPA: glycosyltransferase family 39 protein [Candidatus Binatia bacterium]|nr:glycosyltransferase family 39 protein [Candidatus Binatia bacterium]